MTASLDEAREVLIARLIAYAFDRDRSEHADGAYAAVGDDIFTHKCGRIHLCIHALLIGLHVFSHFCSKYKKIKPSLRKLYRRCGSWEKPQFSG